MYDVILIQGALDIEIEYYVSKLEDTQKIVISEYEFYVGTFNNIKFVISKTLVGTINATIATTIAVMNFSPTLIINQGIAGSHKRDFHIGDIVIGEKCYNINSYNMLARKEGEGSNPFEWELSKRAKDFKLGNFEIVNKLFEFLNKNYDKQVKIGTLGSGDLFSREIDRIDWINKIFNNLSEDMESIAMYSVAEKFNIPCVGIRIISNNELTLEEYDRSQALILEKLLFEFFENI